MSDAGKEDMEVVPSETPKQEKPSANENLKPGSADNDGRSPQKTGSLSSETDLSPSKGSDGSYEKIQPEEVTGPDTEDVNFHKVMQKMQKFQYDITRNQEQTILLKCKALFEMDYKCKMVVNQNFCLNYPVEIIVPVAMNNEAKSTQKLSIDFDTDLYISYVKEGPEARLRSRFVAPVIAFDNKFICRSGTLTVPKTAIYERLTGKTPSLEEASSVLQYVTNAVLNAGAAVVDSLYSMSDPDTMINLFKNDLKILKLCKVGQVFDLMVEYRKTFKEAVELSSTEKGHEDLYGELKLEEMPFPGCEFFFHYSEVGRKGENLIFDWEGAKTERNLTLTENPVACFPEIVTADFKKWDLIQLAQNYLKIMLSYLVQGTESVVVHCISGWDRTPLFISLLRLSLWADGVIHESLEFSDIAYLTVAYDWFLFGHHLPDRLRKHEEIMHFCFNFLDHIVSNEYSITRLFEELPQEKKANRSFPKFDEERRMHALRKVRRYVLEVYEEMNAKVVETKDADGNVVMEETEEMSNNIEKMDTKDAEGNIIKMKDAEGNILGNI